MSNSKVILEEIFQKMLQHFGPQKWWPAETAFEVIVGAVLTQNTNWMNVEKAITQLKQKKLLNFKSLFEIEEASLAELIRPAGYFNVKAKRLKALLRFIFEETEGELDPLFELPPSNLREKLLQVKGVGPETADSILLYAAQKPIFVVDQYTYRVLSRHFLIPEESSYEEMQYFMIQHLPEDLNLFNEYHALIVRVGKEFCKPKAQCENCPLKGVNW
ncbi:MAG: endonuclease III domain-containing protein [Deltaproteobacteria bacterium]|nr:endonuclease III domain-containing protein [Deltaproteobacteria bacterium]